MRSLFNLIIFGAIIGFVMTSPATETNAIVSSIGFLLLDIISFIGNGLLKLVEVIK